VEQQAVRMGRALQAEFWAVSSKTGRNVAAFFRRLAALTFDLSVANECRAADAPRREDIGRAGLLSQFSVHQPTAERA